MRSPGKTYPSPYVLPGLPKVTPLSVMLAICQYFEISREQLFSKDRRRKLAYPRQIYIYLLWTVCNKRLVEIQRIFAHYGLSRNHATVIYSIKFIPSILKTDQAAQADLSRIQNIINHQFETKC